MKTRQTHVICFLVATAVFTSISALAQSTASGRPDSINLYRKGVRASVNNFTGTVWVNMLVEVADSLDSSVGVVTFEPGARTNWHKHPGGQVLIVTDGTGYCQERGKPVQVIRKGDIIKCSPFIEHWHGATATSQMIHTAITTNAEKGGPVWLQSVTDVDYRGAEDK